MAALGCDEDEARRLILNELHDEALEMLEEVTGERFRRLGM
jgi:hypothetical protein